ncbi:MAG: hypothetical protein Q8M92_10015, partial [Candidatus Subteraquimicrobiales bacterium]|nr:hypothetical protein [Candidatus Subteraquimicrobiales bacterium]
MQILKIFLLLLFGYSQVAYGQEARRNRVAITDPREGDAVGGRIVVRGTSEIHDRSHVWVLVHLRLLSGQWWPQTRPVVDENGNWQALAYIGVPEDIGFDFEIVAATFDAQAEAEILRYHDHGNRTGQWLPISFPRTT